MHLATVTQGSWITIISSIVVMATVAISIICNCFTCLLSLYMYFRAIYRINKIDFFFQNKDTNNLHY